MMIRVIKERISNQIKLVDYSGFYKYYQSVEKIFVYSLIFSALLMLNNVFAAELNSHHQAQHRDTFCAGKQVLGDVEQVIVGKNLKIAAKLDTGATMASLSAQHIVIFNRQHKTWVRFTVYLPTTGSRVTFIEPLIKFTRIKSKEGEANYQEDLHNKDYNVRPVIILPVCIGNQMRSILVNLVDRTNFRYPMLIGSNALRQFSILVDASQKYRSSPQCIKKKLQKN